MRVILTADVPELGVKGDVLEVAAGYARNYLVPKSFAIKATDGAILQAEVMRQSRLEAQRKELAEAEELAQSILGSRVVIAAKAGDEGKLFGSVGAADITEAIKKFTGIEIDKGIINLDSLIKEIGIYEVSIRPHTEVEVKITLDVIPA
tara:strand:- start:89 stop:535 length:447 start_codon:yes stop_codon:yes gene_type:complete